MVDQVQVKFGADTGEFKSGASDVRSKLGELDQGTKELGDTFKEIGKIIAEVFAAREIAEFVAKVAELGEQAQHSSQILGVTVEQAQRFGFAVELLGGSSEGATRALTHLSIAMADAMQDPASKAAKAFEQVGISQQFLTSHSNDLFGVLNKVADAYHNSSDGAIKMDNAAAILGARMGDGLIPLLDEGSKGLHRLGNEADETGSVLSDQYSKALANTNDSLKELSRTLLGAGETLLANFLPAIDEGIKYTSELVKEFTSAVNSSGYLADTIGILGGTLRAIVAIIETAVTAFKQLWNVIATGVENSNRLLITFGKVADDVFHGNIEQAKKDWAAGMDAIRLNTEQHFNTILKEGEQWKASMERIFSAPASAAKGFSPGGGITLGQGSMKSPLPQVAPKVEDFSKIDEELFKTHEAMLRRMQEENKENYQKTLQLQKQLVQDIGIHYGRQSKEYENALRQEEQMTKQHTQQIKNAYMQNFITPIGDAFDSMVDGVLRGTQTWQEAFSNMVSDILVKFIEMIVKMLAEWVIFEIATEGQGSWDDFMVLASGGNGGFASLLPSFDVGTPSVPNDMVAMIHQGEMIVPAAQAEQVRGGQGFGGGDNYNVNITVSAIDTQSGAQFLRNNAGALAKAIAGQIRNSNPNVPAWKV